MALYGAAKETDADRVEASRPLDHMVALFGLDPTNKTDRQKVSQAVKRLTRRGLIEKVSGGFSGATATYRIARPWPKKNKK